MPAISLRQSSHRRTVATRWKATSSSSVSSAGDRWSSRTGALSGHAADGVIAGDESAGNVDSGHSVPGCSACSATSRRSSDSNSSVSAGPPTSVLEIAAIVSGLSELSVIKVVAVMVHRPGLRHQASVPKVEAVADDREREVCRDRGQSSTTIRMSRTSSSVLEHESHVDAQPS